MSLAGVANFRPSQPGELRPCIQQPSPGRSTTYFTATSSSYREYIEGENGERIDVTPLHPMIKQVMKDQIVVVDEPDKVGARRLIMLDAFVRTFTRYVRNAVIGIAIVAALLLWIALPRVLQTMFGLHVTDALAGCWAGAWILLYFIAFIAALGTKISSQ